MRFFNIFKSKKRKAIELADAAERYYYTKGYTPVILGSSLHLSLMKKSREIARIVMEPKHFFGISNH